MEWQAPPQNLLVPVTATITWVPMTAAEPITRPMTRSASTDQRALGDVSARHVRRSHPGWSSVCAIVRSLEVDLPTA